MALFYFAGLTTDCKDPDGALCTGDDCLCVDRAATSTILNFILRQQDIKESTLFSKIAIMFTGITAVSLLGVGIFLRDVKLALLGPLASYLLLFLSDFLTVISKVWSISPISSVLITLILGPLFVYYIIAIVEWWGNID